jgi:hypothetical protein
MASPNKQDLNSSYVDTMNDMRAELSTAERLWSAVVNHPLTGAIGVFIISILLRPRALLVGGIFAFISIIGSYVLGRFYGLSLGGTESLFAFALGWVLGLAYDLFFIVTKRHSR